LALIDSRLAEPSLLIGIKLVADFVATTLRSDGPDSVVPTPAVCFGTALVLFLLVLRLDLACEPLVSIEGTLARGFTVLTGAVARLETTPALVFRMLERSGLADSGLVEGLVLSTGVDTGFSLLLTLLT